MAVALALLEDTLPPDRYLPTSFDRPEVWRLADLVHFEESAQYNVVFPSQRLCDVTPALRGGQRLMHTGSNARGNFDAPLSDEELLAKFDLYATPCLNAENRRACADILSDATNAPSANALFRLIAGAELREKNDA